MAIYVVMEPPAVRGNEAAERAVLVRDGFSLPAFVLPLVWLLWHRLWIEAAFVFAVSVALIAFGEAGGFALAGVALSFLMSVFIGLEGPAMRLNALGRRGWREWGVVEGDSSANAEIRYLAEVNNQPDAEPAVSTPTARAAATPPRTVQPNMAHTGPALGLLDYPGRP